MSGSVSSSLSRTSSAGVGSATISATPMSPTSSKLSATSDSARASSQSTVANGANFENNMVRSAESGFQTYRRPFGCAVVEISQLIKAGQSSSATSELTMPIFIPLSETSFSSLHEQIMASRMREFEKSPRAEHVTISLRTFRDDLSAVIRDNPSQLQDTPMTARLGFSDVVFPDDQRNDMYIKLWNGDFPSLAQGSTKLSKANVEVEAEVRARNGQIVPNAISRGTGESNVTRFTSMIFRGNTAPSKTNSLQK